MTSRSKNPGDFVSRVRGENRQYIERLLVENERLAKLLEELQHERTNVDARVTRLRVDLEECADAEREWRKRMEQTEREADRLHGEFAAVEEQNGILASLYVASYSLHGALSTTQLYAAIREIVAGAR